MSWLGLLVPWQPSPTVVAATAIFAWLYFRGCRRQKVSWPRQLAYWTGLGLMYAALHTQLDYYAEREFFIHRLQHLVLHHLGPFLIALAWPGPALRAGLPDSWRTRWVEPALASGPFRAAVNLLMNPLVNGAIFVGLIWLWLLPGVHFFAMLDVRLYRVMNWSVAVDGLLFWFLVMDPRPAPPAHLKPGLRIFLLAAVIPPQMASGALLTFARSNLYPIYDLCGRAFAGIGSLEDQTLGGLILWIPSTMMCMAGALIAIYHWLRLEDKAADRPAVEAVPPAGRRA